MTGSRSLQLALFFLLFACASTGSYWVATGQLFGTYCFVYPAGAVLFGQLQSVQDAAVTVYYDKWKVVYVKQGCGGYYVCSGGGIGSDVGDEVSEGYGWGMVIILMMVGHDPDAQAVFDGMYSFFCRFSSQYSPDLRGWTVTVAGGCKFLTFYGKSDSATDGDLDTAFGLLLADRQWGSIGFINYLVEARKVIAAIKKLEMNPASKTPLLGDWAVGDREATAKYGDSTWPSDFMIDHFRAFGAATGDPFWMGAVDGTHAVVVAFQGRHALDTGLLPDFVVTTTTAPAPAPAHHLEGEADGSYGYNSCRVFWRLVTDWVASGDPRARAAVDRMVRWIEAKTGGDPAKIIAGYTLAGGDRGRERDWAFEAPFGVAGIVDRSHQAWVDAAWTRMAVGSIDGYYPDTIKLLALIVMSGNWWAPSFPGT